MIDRYVYDPDRSVGETALQATKGAFRFATSRIKEMKDHKIAVRHPSPMPVPAALNSGVGRLRNMGAVARRRSQRVQSGGKCRASKVRASTDIAFALDPPGEPKAWPEEKVSRAIATVALHRSLGMKSS